MPRTVAKATPLLEILLDGGESTYRPGDTITGRVVRSAPIVSSQASLNIQFHGRSKSKMTVSRGQAGTSVYRGRFNFFDPGQNRQQLFYGPIHIPPDGAMKEWPFAITVPTALDPSTVATGNQQKASYLPLGPHDVATHSLPPVFHASGVWMITTTYHCFVEYFLEAELNAEGTAGSTDKATLPVNVIPAYTPDMITDFDLSRRSFLCRISTYHLVPGMEAASLSFQQRTQKFFGSSKVPQFAFSLQVECPGILQLGNPHLVPFRVLVIPDRTQTTEAIRDNSQTVTLTAMNFEIRASTKLICRGTLAPHTSSETRKVGFDLKSAIAQLGAPIVLPSGEKSEPLDVGALLQLSITSATPRGQGPFSRYKGQLYPSFETYNIKHNHRLRWELTVTTAGESTTLSNEVDITLLPLSGLPLYEPPLDELPAYDKAEGGDWPKEKE
ncbi:hypothetical protein QBC33DRAFT_547439 [Phialemonium atrogriseum]|uniref:Arrestin-like N-terminal domain-containing protein n=1 Tax=Phialemonium atrogriseum TaxID=1093897 RepID=A0AAJ0BW45_9PEZI|nr:uncharacterized protein QBC33DRAFT_547439 [Phialemonium atrogriseum]KAK1764508.1 hypothetical protein QBC33DRAFT_547439 [Phialemonium atrogriseum]